MLRTAKNRNSRLEARISPEALAIVRRAAEIQGRSVSDFVSVARAGRCTKSCFGNGNDSALA